MFQHCIGLHDILTEAMVFLISSMLLTPNTTFLVICFEILPYQDNKCLYNLH